MIVVQSSFAPVFVPINATGPPVDPALYAS